MVIGDWRLLIGDWRLTDCRLLIVDLAPVETGDHLSLPHALSAYLDAHGLRTGQPSCPTLAFSSIYASSPVAGALLFDFDGKTDLVHHSMGLR